MNEQRLFRYDRRANQDALENLRQTEHPPATAMGLLAHIIGAEWLWLDRLHSRPASIAVWPSLSVGECENHLRRLAVAWDEYLATLVDDQRTKDITYVNSKGESWHSSVEDILMHVIMHGSYHRGQIATRVRDVGRTPAYTDYIHVARQGWLG